MVEVFSPSLITHTAGSGGKAYLAPELHEPERFGSDEFCRTTVSDVYAFGSLCLEVRRFLPMFDQSLASHHVLPQVFTGLPQHPDLPEKRNSEVIMRILNKIPTKRPTVEQCFGHNMPDLWW